MNKLSDREVRKQAQAEIRQLIAMLEGSLTASGWDNPVSQIEFLLDVCVGPTVESLKELVARAERPSGYRPGIPEGVALPGAHEQV